MGHITRKNYFSKKGLGVLSNYDDCNFIHYSLQLNLYKAIIHRVLGILVGNLYLVHFNYTKQDDTFEVIPCLDMQSICNKILDDLQEEAQCH